MKQIIKDMYELYQEGKTLEAVGYAYGISKQAVWERFTKHGLSTRRYTSISMDLISQGQKFCNKCKKVKPLSDFYKNGKYYNGKCLECDKIYRRDYYRKRVENEK
jgi:hypothetical protein